MKHVIKVATEWSKLFKVKCHHDFYDKGICRDLKFVPTRQTQIDMRNLKLVYREQEGGFIILCKKSSTLPLLRNRYSQIQKLSFFLDAQNKSFFNFSEIPFSSFEKLYYFSNLKGHKKVGSGINIHKNEYLNLSPDQRVGIRPKFFSITLDKPLKQFKPVLKNQSGTAIPSKYFSCKLSEDRQKLYLDLRSVVEGLYSFKVGNYSTAFYLMDDFADFHWGVLEIHLQDLPKDISLFNTTEITGQNFLFHIEPRKTYWKYIFVEKENDFKEGEINDVKISIDGAELDFTKPQSHTLVDGRQARYIESKKPLQMKEVRWTRDKVEMRLKRGKKWMTKVVKAPKPQNEMLKPDKNGNKIYSVIYVNI